MADTVTRGHLAGATRVFHEVPLPRVLSGATVSFRKLETIIRPDELNAERPPICEEQCGRNAPSCKCNPQQCPLAINGSLES
jgi:hypothetical protein